MPLVQTRGAASAQGFGEFAQAAATAANYIEEMFSCFLYTGTGAALTITNDIDLSTNGGLVWLKDRTAANRNVVVDTTTGVGKLLSTNLTDDQGNYTSGLTAFNANGFSLGSAALVNTNNNKFVSWSFRNAPKFFVQGTFTGTGSAQSIAHSLGSTPACIIVKRTNAAASWAVYHRSTSGSPATEYLNLNSTSGTSTDSTFWNNTAPTSSVFTVGSNTETNASGSTYVYYLFAHDAGGFGLAGTDNVISCGSFVGAASVTVNLGYEPQWILYKKTTGVGDWCLYDTMRGLTASNISNQLNPNSSAAEAASTSVNGGIVTPTGFNINADTAFNAYGETFIYIAIRRGPMKVPTVGTSVYTGSLAASSVSVSAGFVPDLAFVGKRDTSGGVYVGSRLQGSSVYLNTYNTAAEAAFGWVWDGPTKTWMQTSIGADVVNWLFARAPSVCDVVCYTGTGVARTVTHNLTVAPELIIVKNRDSSNSWITYCEYLSAPLDDRVFVNSSNAKGTSSGTWKIPTTTTWGMDINFSEMNTNGTNYVSYLFATCAGVSKVGSYTGTGTTLQINCGFTAGARFVLIKRTNSASSDWYVWDSARGIVAGNDPYLLLNSNAAEVTGTDYIDTYSAGFEISSTAPAAINGSGDSFIFLAIA
jgi:hypothetical protein